MAQYTLSYDSRSVTFLVTGLTAGQYVELYVRLSSDTDATIVDASYTATGSTLTRTFSNVLTPGVKYAANVKVGTDNVNSAWIGRQRFTTPEEPKPAVSPWSWSQSNGGASAAQTSAAYAAVTSRGKLSSFSYLVWNDMVDKAMEILQANGFGWDNTYATYSATRIDSGNRTLTAAKFNSLLLNIDAHSSTGISKVSRGSTVYGWYFTRLTDRMNAMI